MRFILRGGKFGSLNTQALLPLSGLVQGLFKEVISVVTNQN